MTRSVYQSGFSRNTELMWYTVSPAPLSTGNIFQDCHQVPETVDSAKCYPGRTFGSVQKVIDIWSCPKHPSNIFSIPKSFLKFSPVQNIHKAFGPYQRVLDIWRIICSFQISMTFDPHQKILDIWLHFVLSKTSLNHLVYVKISWYFGTKPFDMNQICSWTFWIRPNFKNFLVWIKCLMDVLDKTRYQGHFCMNQIFYGYFAYDQIFINPLM